MRVSEKDTWKFSVFGPNYTCNNVKEIEGIKLQNFYSITKQKLWRPPIVDAGLGSERPQEQYGCISCSYSMWFTRSRSKDSITEDTTPWEASHIERKVELLWELQFLYSMYYSLFWYLVQICRSNYEAFHEKTESMFAI